MTGIKKCKNTYLVMNQVSKSFGAVKALTTANLEVKKGEIHALMGENGAGKSTLMNILSGSLKPDGGKIFFEGVKLALHSPIDAKRKGIAKIHQELQLVPELTVAENIFLGREKRNKFGFVNYKAMNEEAVSFMKEFELAIDPTAKVKDLRVGEQQLIEIVKAISLDVKVLIMDEPTSALSKNEAYKLFKVVKRLSSEGVSIIYITHRMEEVFELTHRVTVMRDGTYIGTVETKDTSKAQLVKMMVGRELTNLFHKEVGKVGKEILKIKNLSVQMPKHSFKCSLKEMSLSVRQGEVLGIAGLMGAGRTELLESIFGLHHKSLSGDIYIQGEKVDIDSPAKAIQSGVAFVTEDRKAQGLVLGRSIGENISLPLLKSFSKLFFMDNKLERPEWQRQLEELRIKAPSYATLLSNLSGGNQQKVILARWLLTKPKILLLDEPTRGIDVGARGEIYQLINGLAKEGIGIIVVSSELPEVIGIADRIVTFCEGRLTGEFTREEATQEKLLAAATLRKEAM